MIVKNIHENFRESLRHTFFDDNLLSENENVKLQKER